jgi:hypothetical protein
VWVVVLTVMLPHSGLVVYGPVIWTQSVQDVSVSTQPCILSESECAATR